MLKTACQCLGGKKTGSCQVAIASAARLPGLGRRFGRGDPPVPGLRMSCRSCSGYSWMPKSMYIISTMFCRTSKPTCERRVAKRPLSCAEGAKLSFFLCLNADLGVVLMGQQQLEGSRHHAAHCTRLQSSVRIFNFDGKKRRNPTLTTQQRTSNCEQEAIDTRADANGTDWRVDAALKWRGG